MTDENDKKQKQPRPKRDIRRVNDLYRSADRLYGGFDETIAPGLRKAAATANPLQTVEARPDDASDTAKHLWMVHALKDMLDYAQQNNLHLVRLCVADAHLRVAEILGAHVPSDAPVSSAPDSNDESGC